MVAGKNKKMDSKPSNTRIELFTRRAQLELAQHGHELLEEKRTVLMHEIMKIANTVLEDTEAVQRLATQASNALARAEVIAGPEAVQSAALIAIDNLPLTIETNNVMGIQVPSFKDQGVARSFMSRGYAVTGTSLCIDEVAEQFEVEVEGIIRLAESELRLRRLVKEFKRTSRRLNALEYLLIPRLKRECNQIQMALDERERNDHFRLKLSKRLLERKRIQSSQSSTALRMYNRAE